MVIRTKNDGMYEGVFCTLSPKAAFVIKCAHKIDKKPGNTANGVRAGVLGLVWVSLHGFY